MFSVKVTISQHPICVIKETIVGTKEIIIPLFSSFVSKGFKYFGTETHLEESLPR
jgi:hypothetical protein